MKAGQVRPKQTGTSFALERNTKDFKSGLKTNCLLQRPSLPTIQPDLNTFSTIRSLNTLYLTNYFRVITVVQVRRELLQQLKRSCTQKYYSTNLDCHEYSMSPQIKSTATRTPGHLAENHGVEIYRVGNEDRSFCRHVDTHCKCACGKNDSNPLIAKQPLNGLPVLERQARVMHPDATTKRFL